MPKYTPNLGLLKPLQAERNWGDSLNTNADILDTAVGQGGFTTRPRESPSTSLFIQVNSGNFNSWNHTPTTSAGGTLALPASTVSTVWLSDGGVLTSSLTWPTAPHVRLAQVWTDSTKILTVVDARASLTSAGLPPASAAQAIATTSATTITDSTGGTAGGTLVAIVAGSSYSQTDCGNIKNNLASLALAHNAVIADLANLKTLLNQLRTDLITDGQIKGSA